MKIPHASPSDELLFPEALQRLQSCLQRARSEWDYVSGISGEGPIAHFERRFGREVGGRYTLALTNCTSALTVALLAAGVGPGDEVIVPSYAWPQTLTPVIVTGATPVFADIMTSTVTVDPEAVARLVSPKTRAIIAAHLYGMPADAEALARVAKLSRCALIYDAAQGFGARVHERPVGAYGDYVAFSFGRGKLFCVGEGGALVCRRRSGYERAVALSQHPLRSHKTIDDPSLREKIDGIAMNFRFQPLIAALALGQLEGLRKAEYCEQLRSRYQEVVQRLLSLGMHHLLPDLPEGATSSGVTVPLLVRDDEEASQVKRQLGDIGYVIIEGGLFQPLHMTPTIQNHRLAFGNVRIPSHPTHWPGSCPQAEARCRLPQVFVKLHR